MNYYQAYLNPEPKIIGVNNGIFQIEIDKEDLWKNNLFEEFREFFSYNNKTFWRNQENIFNLKIPLIKAKLLKKAKVTDLMGYTPNITFIHYLYSLKYIEILNKFNINRYKTFEVKIEGVNEKFYMFYPLTILLEDINYEKSVIYTGHKMLNNVKYYVINNYEDYHIFLISNPIHAFEKICISKEYKDLDFISIQGMVDNFYSKRLIEELIKSKITGLHVNYNSSVQLDFY